MRFILHIDCENAAFTDGPDPNAARAIELDRILRKTAARVLAAPDLDAGTVLDVNGNSVGRWEIG